MQAMTTDEVPNPDRVSKPVSRRRYLPRRRHLFAGMASLMLLAVALYSYWTFADVSPPDLSDLTPRYPRDSGVRNGFRHLDRHESEVWLPPDYPSYSAPGAAVGFHYDETMAPWSEPLATEIIARNATILESVAMGGGSRGVAGRATLPSSHGLEEFVDCPEERLRVDCGKAL